MKKITAILLAALMIFSITACKAPADAPEGGGAEQPQEQASEEKLTLKDGVLSVALSPDFAPMEFVDTSKSGQEQYVGFDVTLAKFIAEELGLELEIQAMGFDACQAAVQANAVDMSISGFSWTEERAENYNLSDYYYAGDNETEQTIIVLAENAGKWTSAESYSGLKVAAQVASLQLSLCEEQLPEDCEVVTYANIGTSIEALRSGMVDGVAVAYGNGEAIISNNDAVAMSGFNFDVSEEASNNVIMLNKDSDALLEEVNKCLAKAYESGYYVEWYEEAKALAGIESAQELTLE